METKRDISSDTVALNNGVHIPRVGLGVYQARPGEETQHAILEALRLGYRHIDTARIYGNERDVGLAMARSGLPRSDIFLTTKLWNDDQGYDSALRAFHESLKRLACDYIDLYLLHWPVPGRRLESWRALETLLDEGVVRSIGVSNFMVPHLRELLENCATVPTVNQIEVSPFLQQHDVRAYCSSHAIVVEAYSPLTRGHKLDHPTVLEVARRVGRTPAQVLLRWGLENDLVVLPKSTHPTRIAENAALFDFSLDPASMALLNGLEAGFVTGWDPREAP